MLPVPLVVNEIKDDSDVFDMTLIGMYHQRLNRQKQIDTKYNKCICVMTRMLMIQEMIIQLLYNEG